MSNIAASPRKLGYISSSVCKSADKQIPNDTIHIFVRTDIEEM